MTLTNNYVTYLTKIFHSTIFILNIHFWLFKFPASHLYNHILEGKYIVSKTLRDNIQSYFCGKKRAFCFVLFCFTPEKYIREFSRSNGLLRTEKQSYRKSHRSPFSRCWRRTCLEGTNSFTLLKIFMVWVCLTLKVEICFPFHCAEKRLFTPGHPRQPNCLFPELCHKHGYVCACSRGLSGWMGTWGRWLGSSGGKNM